MKTDGPVTADDLKFESEPEIRFIEGEFERIVIGKNDVIVLSCPGMLEVIIHERIILNLKEVFPDHKCILLEEGIKLGAVSMEKE